MKQTVTTKKIKLQSHFEYEHEAKLSAGKNLNIQRSISVLLGMCMLPKRRQIYFTSNFWFQHF